MTITGRGAGTIGAIMLLAFLVDQGSKWLILHHIMQPPQVIDLLPFLNLRLGFNTGVSFGLFQDVFDEWPLALAGAKLVIVGGLIIWAMLSEQAAERIGLSLIAGGALGNIVDRWRQGAVTDFLDLHWRGWHWPTFNMADVAITAGAALIMLSAIRPGSPAAREVSG